MFKKPVVLSLLTGIIILLLGAVIYYFTSYHNLTINYSLHDKMSSAPVKLYSTKQNDENHGETPDKFIADVKSGESIKLRDSIYYIKTDGEDFKENPVYINLSGSDQTAEYEVSYTANKLESIEKSEIEAAREALKSEYPKAEELYTLSRDKLLHLGDWYVVYLTYKDQDSLSRDTLRVVLHKEKDEWKVVTKPQISIGAPEYPDIPMNVLEYANKELGA